MLSSRKIFSIFTLIFATVFFSGTLLADPPEHKGKQGNSKSKGTSGGSDISFDADLSVIVTAGISIGDARNLASRYELPGSKPMPPGIRKNLARGKPMPPGIQKTRMPESFINQLPYHKGYEWQQAGTDLVLVVSGSLVISDILKGVFD